MKLSRIKKSSLGLLTASCLALSSCSAAGAEPNKTKVYKMSFIASVPTATSYVKRVKTSGRDVSVSLIYEAVRGKPISSLYRSHNPVFVESMVKNTSSIMNAFLQYKNITYRPCRGYEYNLIIAVVSKAVLQDDDRFRSFYRSKYGVDAFPNHTLYGYYDSTPEVKYNSSMILTDISPSWNEEVFAHEMAHYWWDRLCVQPHYRGTSEQFATEFQHYYMRGKR